MSRVKNIIYKVNENSNNNEKNEKNKKSRVGSIIERVTSEKITTSVDNNYINSYISDANSFLLDVGDKYKDLGYGNATKYYNDFSMSSDDLINRGKTIRAYLNSNKNQYDLNNVNDLFKYIDEVEKSRDNIWRNLRDAAQFYSNWETEDAYNKALEYAANQRAMLDYDKEEGAKTISDLETTYSEALKIANDIDTRAKMVQSGYQRAGTPKTIEEIMASDSVIAELTKQLETYGDVDALNKDLQEKKRFHTLAERAQRGVELNSVSNPNATNYDSQFEQYVSQGKAMDNGKTPVSIFGNTISQNPIEAYRRYYSDLDMRSATDDYGAGRIGNDASFALAMTENEVNTYNYYLAKDKENGTKYADEYLDIISDDVNQRIGSSYFSQIEGKTGQELLFGVNAGVDQFASGIKGLFADGYTAPSPIQYASSAVREDLADDSIPIWYNVKEGKWEDKVLGNSAAQMAYDTTTTVSNMLPSIMVSFVPVVGQAAGAITLGASAAGHAKVEMLNLGYSKSQANLYGAMVGASEAGLQYLLGGITKFGGKASKGLTELALSKVDNAFARVAISLGMNMASEGLEESLQTVIEPWLKSLATGVDFEAPDIDEVLYSGLLGTISALLMEGGTTIAGEVGIKKQGEKLKASGADNINALTNLGKDFAEGTTANRLANGINENSSAYAIGRLLTEVGAGLSERNITDIAAELRANGMSSEAATDTAKWLYKAVDGGYFNKRQQEAYLNDDRISDVHRNLFSNEEHSVNKRNAEYDALYALAQEMSNNKGAKTKAKDASVEVQATTTGGVAVNKELNLKDKISSKKQTTNEATGEAVVIDKNNAIAKVENGNVYYNTDKGVVPLTDVTYASEEEGVLYEGFSDLNPAIANALISNYDGKISARAYVNGAREGILLYGKNNFQAVGKDIPTDTYFADLSEADQAFTLKLGKTYSKMEAEQKDENLKTAIKNAAEKAAADSKASGTTTKKGNVRFDSRVDRSKLNRIQKRTVSLAKHLSKAIGIDIVFYDATKAGTKHNDSNGYFDPKDNSIHLDLQNATTDSKTIAFTLSHELVHFIKKWSPAKFKAFADFLMEQYAEHGVSTSTMLANKMAALKTTDADYAYEEMIADACERMLLDSNAVVKLMELRKSDLELFEKIKLHVLEILNKIRDAFKGVDPNTEEGIALQKMEDVLGKLHEMFEDAALDAAKTYGEAQALGMESVVVSEDGIKKQAKKTSRITIGMSDTERSEILKGKSVVAAIYEGQADILVAEKKAELESRKIEFAKSAILEIAEKLEIVGKEIDFNDVEVKIMLSKSNLKESMSKEATPEQIAKLLPVLSPTAENSVVIERHDNRYFYDTDTVYFDNLLGVYVDGDSLVPVRFGLKHSRTGATTLYVVVDQNKIALENLGETKKDRGLQDASPAKAESDSLRRSVTYSISQIVPFVNSKDLLRYLPDDMLNGEQKRIKWEGIAETIRRTNDKNDKKYKGFIDSGNLVAAQQMVKAAAKANGYPVRLLHGTQKFGFTVPDTSVSDDKLSFFATNDVDTAKTYSSLGGTRGIRDGVNYDDLDAEFSAHEENARDKAYELADSISRWAGYYGYVEGDYIHERLSEIANQYERGHIDADQADSEMYDFLDEIIANGYSEDSYDGQEFAEWQETDEAEKLYTKGSKTIGAYLALADFGRNAESSGNYDLYANVDGFLVIDGNGAKWNDIKSDTLPDITSEEYKKYGYRGHWDKWTTRSVAKYASDNGYRGVLFKNIYDDGGKSSSEITKPADVYAFFYPKEQVKSADPITYDDSDNIIPISERFNAENNDIRFQKKTVTNRTLLANALESAAKEGDERNDLRNYQTYIRLIDEEKKRAEETQGTGTLEALNEQVWSYLGEKYTRNEVMKLAKKRALAMDLNPDAIRYMMSNDELIASIGNREILRAENDTHGTYKKEVSDIQKRIKLYETELTKLESKKTIQRILKREREAEYKRAEQKGKEALKKYREKVAEQSVIDMQEKYREWRSKASASRSKTKLKGDTRKLVTSLTSLLENGNKKRNIKTEEHKVVTAALELAKVLLSNDLTNEDIVRLGVKNATKEELALLNEYKAHIVNLDAVNGQIAGMQTDEKLSKEGYALMDELEATKKDIKEEMSALSRKLSDLFARERFRLNETKIEEFINALIAEYSVLAKSDKAYIKNAYREEVKDRLTNLKTSLGDKMVRDMDIYQLTELYDTLKMIEKMVRLSNKLFIDGKLEDLKSKVSAVEDEVMAATDVPKEYGVIVSKLESAFREFSWNNLRPIDAFERLGSPTLEKLFWDFVDGMTKAGQIIRETGEAIYEARTKYGYSKWKLNEVSKTFTTRDGLVFKPTLADKLSIYAYSQREQAEKHMLDGGFVFDTGATYKEVENGKTYVRKKLSQTYRMDDITIGSIIASLTQEQRDYVDAILPIFTALGEMGNEVSDVMYGIALFKEKVYFPLQTSADYRSSTSETLNSTPTMSSMTNSGFTKQTVPNADNPIVLRAFDDVMLEHIEKMANWTSLVLPIENLRKVFENVSREEDRNSKAIKALIGERYGVEAQKYFEQWITDINGGVSPQGAKSLLMKFFSRAKKTQVALSMSVVSQQYSSIFRAMELVDPKYFTPFINKEARLGDEKAYDELIKYAPIAIIKEMGGFDVGSGRNAKSYIGDKGARMDAKHIGRKIDDVSMWGASLMDKLGWVTIWKAVKAEVAEEQKLKVGTDEFFEACKKRFTEVVVKTQVFDSVASRSGYMRSQSDSVKFATSFMGEPTAIVGRLYMSAVKLERAIKSKDKKAIWNATKHFARTASAISVANSLGNLAKTLWYASRDDEEDEALLEKWMNRFAQALIDDLNILNSLPFARDAVSIIQGFDIERPDTTLLKELVTSTKKFVNKAKDEEATVKDGLDLLGSVSSMLGFAAKNLIRDTKAVINIIESILDDVKPTDVSGAFINGITGKKRSTTEALYHATVNKDKGKVNAIRSGYKTESAYQSALRTALTENDPRIVEAVVAWFNEDTDKRVSIIEEIESEGYFTPNVVRSAINNEKTRVSTRVKEAINAKQNGNTREHDKIVGELLEVYPKSLVERLIKEKLDDFNNKKPEVEAVTSVFNTDDINIALKNGNTKQAKNIINELIKVKTQNNLANSRATAQYEGKKFDEKKALEDSEKTARSAVKSSITEYWKPLVIEAYKSKKTSEKLRIRDILFETGLYGKYRSDVSDAMEKWYNDYLKEQS